MNNLYHITFIFLAYWVILKAVSTTIHEYIHYAIANHYKPCKAVICSQFNWYKKNKNIKWKKNKLFRGGFTALDNDFLDYTDKQIKIIAIMPQFIIACMLMCGYIPYYFAMVSCMKYTAPLFVSMMKTYLVFLGIIVFIMTTFRGSSTWCDRNVFANPSGFREYMTKQRKTTGEDSYKYNLKSIEKD